MYFGGLGMKEFRQESWSSSVGLVLVGGLALVIWEDGLQVPQLGQQLTPGWSPLWDLCSTPRASEFFGFFLTVQFPQFIGVDFIWQVWLRDSTASPGAYPSAFPHPAAAAASTGCTWCWLVCWLMHLLFLQPDGAHHPTPACSAHTCPAAVLPLLLAPLPPPPLFFNHVCVLLCG